MDGRRPPFVLDLPDGYVVREAEGADAAGIASVYADAYPAGTEYPLVSERRVRRDLVDDESVRPFVVETDGELVAAAAIEYDSLDEGNAQICKLAVRRAHRGNGLGRVLLKHRLNVLATDESFSGLVYVAAVTAHPASQHNLVARGFAPFSFHKNFQGGYFGPGNESEIIMLYTDSIEYAERRVYVPERYRHVVERTLAQVSLDLLGRRLVLTEDVAFPTLDVDCLRTGIEHNREFLWEVTASGTDAWVETEAELTAAIRRDDTHLMVPIDANTPALASLYDALEADGFSPAGFIPDWLTRDGEKRDAFVFQHPPHDEPTRIDVVADVKALIEVLGVDYRVLESHDRYWTLEI